MAISLRPFDDRDGFIWLDGKMIPWRDAKVHVLTHGLHYASSVFEGERAYGGQIFKLREHSDRLIFSAGCLGMKLPYTVEEIDAASTEVLVKNGIKDGYVRPMVWRGAEQMGVSAPKAKIHVMIAAWDDWATYYDASQLMQGIRLQWSDWRRPDPRTIPSQAKAAGLYMICTIAKHKADAEGYQDAFMLDWEGRVAEATSANFFMIKDGKLHTPIADCFLNGITRQTVLELAPKLGIEVVERRIWPTELAGAQEAFLCGTAAELTPVREIGDYKFTPGRVCETLMRAYSATVRGQPISKAA